MNTCLNRICRLLFLTAVLLAVLLGGSQAMAAPYGPPPLTYESFESGFSSCWGREYQPGGAVTVEPSPGGTQSAHFVGDGVGGCKIEALLGYGETTLTTGHVAFDLYREHGGGAAVLSSEAQWIAGIRWFYGSSNTEIYTGGGWQSIPATVSAGQWHRVVIEFFGDRHRWALWLDGQRLGEWDIPVFNPYNMSVGYAGRVKIMTAGSGSFYVDNVLVARTGGTGLGGVVVDAVTGDPIPGATVQVRRGGRTTTNANGRFYFDQVVREWNFIPSNVNVVVRAWAPGHQGAVQHLWLDAGTHRTDIVLSLPRRTEPEEGQVSGRIADALTGLPVLGASVTVGGQPANIYGSTYLAMHVPAGQAQVNVSVPGYQPASSSCTVYSDYTTDRHFKLQKINPGRTPQLPTVDVTDSSLSIRFRNRARVKLMLMARSEILGFGEVSVSGVSLRKVVASGVPKINQQGSPRQYGTDIEDQFSIPYAGCRYVSWEYEWDKVVVHSELYLENGEVDHLDWVIAPRDIMVRGRRYTGIAYGFRFRSASRKIGQIENRMTWELGGTAQGNTLICGSTAGVNQEYDLTTASSMQVYWPSYAFLHMSPLDYQINRANGWELASFPETPAVMLIQPRKRPNADVVEYLSLTLVGATQTAETPMRSVLLGTSPGIDQWTNLLDYVQSQARAFYGMDTIAPYTMGRPESMTTWNFQTAFHGGPGLLDNGSYHQDEIPHPQYNITPWSYEPGGGAAHLQSITNSIHQAGVKAVSWIGLLFAEYSSVLREHPQWIGREDWDGDYIPVYADATHIDIRTGFLTYSLEKLKEAAALGLDGVWLDSYGMIGAIDYGAPEPRPSLDVFCQRQVELQRSGMTVFYGEAMGGTFAIGGSYPSVWPDGMLTVPNESQLYLAYLTGPLCDFGIYPMRFDYYKYLAHKAPPIVQQGQLNSDPQKPQIIQANLDYRRAFPYMRIREVLSGGNGVLWHYGDPRDTRILFAFTNFSLPIGTNESIYDITTLQPVSASGSLAAQSHHTYKLYKTTTDDWKKKGW